MKKFMSTLEMGFVCLQYYWPPEKEVYSIKLKLWKLAKNFKI